MPLSHQVAVVAEKIGGDTLKVKNQEKTAVI